MNRPSEGMRQLTKEEVEALHLPMLTAEEAEALRMPREVEAALDVLDPASQEADAIVKACSQKAMADSLLSKPEPAGRGDEGRNIDRALGLYQAALSVITRDRFPSLWAEVMSRSAGALTQRQEGDPAENVELAIRRYDQALEVWTRASHPDRWADVMNSLGFAYREWLGGDREANLEEAISLFRRALRVWSRRRNRDYWVAVTTNLAAAYEKRVKGARRDNLERAITCARAALAAAGTPKDLPPEGGELRPGALTPELERWGALQNNLGVQLSQRIVGNRGENLEEAIAAYTQALRVRTRTAAPLDWAGTTSNLGITYRQRIEGHWSENEEHARRAFEDALEVLSAERSPRQWADVKTNLGNLYKQRIQGDRLANLEAAIQCYEDAATVRLSQGDRLEWAKAMSNRGSVYLDRLTGDPGENVEEAIRSLEAALQVRTAEGSRDDWAETMIHLGNAYGDRSTGDPDANIRKAVACYEAAAGVLDPERTPLPWAMVQNDLGNAYHDPRTKDYARSVAAYRAALAARPMAADPLAWAQTTTNLGNVYRDMADGGSTTHLADAVMCYRDALNVVTPESAPRECQNAAAALGDTYAKLAQWSEASSAYQVALAAAEVLYRSAVLRSSREAQLEAAANLPCRAAYAAARAGAPTLAIEMLDRGRARSLADALARDRAELDRLKGIDPGLQERYVRAAAAVRSFDAGQLGIVSQDQDRRASLEEIRVQGEAAAAELDTAIAAIRHLPGYERFLELPNLEDILAAARDSPLVYIAPATDGGLALIAAASGVEAILLPSLQQKDLQEGVEGYWAAHQHRTEDAAAWEAALDGVTRWLWDAAVGRIVSRLGAVPAAVLVPFGPLALLPLHAAWTENADAPSGRRYALDRLTLSYAPNARGLQIARSLAERSTPDSLLAIGDPSPVPDWVEPLPDSPTMVQAVCAYFPTHVRLLHDQAALDEVRRGLPGASVHHFDCHATANLHEPLKSGLLLKGRDGVLLTLRDLLAMELPGARLSVLSACESSLPGVDLPDEVLSLPTGLLHAGAAGVVASLWAVTDDSAVILMFRFYDLWRNAGLAPAEALRQAEQWLRDSSNDQLYDYFAGFATQVGRPGLAAAAQALSTRVSYRDPRAHDFQHPRYWAAFSYTGA